MSAQPRDERFDVKICHIVTALVVRYDDPFRREPSTLTVIHVLGQAHPPLGDALFDLSTVRVFGAHQTFSLLPWILTLT
jgi:hypothetical protein